jgi:ribosomal protein L11 methyltransferase
VVSPVQWQELAVQCSRLASEAVAVILHEFTNGLVVEDQPVGVTYRGYLPLTARTPDLIAQIRQLLAGLPAEVLAEGAPSLTLGLLDEEDWAEAWKRFYDPLRIGQRLVVKPTWKDWPPAGQPELATAEDILIELDPGMAFGTGSHPTTWQCLEALEKHVQPGMRILDLGCGSGILTVGALKLGAVEVLAIDNDELATSATAKNCLLNGVSGCKVLEHTGLDGLPGDFDIIIANISSNIIRQQALLVTSHLAPGGLFICSGFYVGHEEEIGELIESQGLEMIESLERELWSCMVARKP